MHEHVQTPNVLLKHGVAAWVFVAARIFQFPITVSCVFGTPPYPNGVSESHQYTWPTRGGSAVNDCADMMPTNVTAKINVFMLAKVHYRFRDLTTVLFLVALTMLAI